MLLPLGTATQAANFSLSWRNRALPTGLGGEIASRDRRQQKLAPNPQIFRMPQVSMRCQGEHAQRGQTNIQPYRIPLGRTLPQLPTFKESGKNFITPSPELQPGARQLRTLLIQGYGGKLAISGAQASFLPLGNSFPDPAHGSEVKSEIVDGVQHLRQHLA